MSATGVLLAYKRQIINFADRGFQSQPAPGAQQLAMDELLARLVGTQGQAPSAITVRSDPAAPVAFDFGRERTLFMNPYSGQVLGEESPELRAFFSAVENLHRSLGRSPERRASGHAITGACNLGFLVLVMTGPVLWWPKEWSRRNLKKITLLRRGPWVRARDWNWHNALGLWCVIPLFLIVVTGVIMSYGWTNGLLYRITGNEPPIQGSPAPLRSLTGPTRFDGLDKRFARARLQVPGWTAISVRLQNAPKGVLTFSIDQGNGGRPDLRSQLTLDDKAGLVRWEPFPATTPDGNCALGPDSPTPGRPSAYPARPRRPLPLPAPPSS